MTIDHSGEPLASANAASHFDRVLYIDPVLCRKCPYCRICIDICENDALKCTMSGFTPSIYQSRCCECGTCIQACPTSAIRFIDLA